MDHDSRPESLNPKMKATRKPSKKYCLFLLPSRMTKEGRTIITKRCTAYIPNFEVTEDREICEVCSVPDMLVREERCRYFAPLDLVKCQVTRWRCTKTGIKYIEADQCNENICPDYEKAEKDKWEIGKLEKSSEEERSDDGKGKKALETPSQAEPSSRMFKLIPKTTFQKKGAEKK
ncbi:MAG: hypothetical protein RDV48_13505 [Candidatus Eremiobacteraeota bacterium]|nr:hypothetical protein [Candidatus Eremiobacteraeota bacterium]